MKFNFLPIFDVYETPDYPYGYSLRTTKTDWIEYKKGKGFRHLSQTVNPKTGKPNKPKASTYSDFVRMYIEAETGHLKTYHFSHYNQEGYERALTSGLFEEIPSEIYDHERNEINTILVGISFLLRFCGFGSDTFTPPTLSDEQKQALKSNDIPTLRKLSEELSKASEEARK